MLIMKKNNRNERKSKYGFCRAVKFRLLLLLVFSLNFPNFVGMTACQIKIFFLWHHSHSCLCIALDSYVLLCLLCHCLVEWLLKIVTHLYIALAQ